MIIKKILILAIAAMATMSCSSDDDNNNNQISIEAIADFNEVVRSGEWTISSYMNSENDETDSYAGYTLVFNNDGTLDATNGETTVQGIWSISWEDNFEDDNTGIATDNIRLFMSFTSPAAFTNLTDDWHLSSYHSSRIHLNDVGSSNSVSDYLSLTKN